MAEQSEIDRFRRVTDLEVDDPVYTNQVISDLIDNLGFSAAVATVWREKAARYASMIDITESGSSRRFSQLYDQAWRMANNYDPQEEDTTTGGGSYTVPIERM